MRRAMSAPGEAQSTARVRAACFAAGIAFATVAPPWRHPAVALAGWLLFSWSRTAVAADRRGASAGLSFGLGANLVGLAFVTDVIDRFTPLGRAAALLAWVLLAAAQALPFAIAAAASARLERAGCPAPLAFALSIYLGSFTPMLFPWTVAGAFGEWPVWLQSADAVGVRGCGALFALAAGLAAAGLTPRCSPVKRRLPLIGGALALAAGILAFGHHRGDRIAREERSCPHATVALVQSATQAEARSRRGQEAAILEALQRSTARARDLGAELVVWPEAAYPYVLTATAASAPTGPRDPRPSGDAPPILMGLETRGARGLHNSALLVHPDGTLSAPQHKVHLLWFGEVVPFADELPWLARTFARGTGLVAGEGVVLQSAGRIRAAVLNCYEDTLVAAGREAAHAGANLLVNVSNDAWFDEGHASELHATLSRGRAIETRLHLVRAVNRGATMWVDSRGEVRARTLAPEVSAVLMTRPTLCEGTATAYARYGDVPFALLLTLAAALALVAVGKMAKAPAP